MSEENKYQPATIGVRGGIQRTDQKEQGEPIFTTSSFVFDSAEQAEARFSGREQGNIYSRFTNPTVNTFERKLAAMEGGERCVATASGMAAILATCLSVLKSGDHLVASRGIFGSTAMLFNNYLANFGIETSYVSLTDYTSWQSTIKENTRLLFVETPSNPLSEVADIRKLANIAHENECLLVVDNTVCTPALQRPLSLGADVVVLSATKYIDGQGRCVGGAVVGDSEIVGEKVYGFVRTAGPCMSPFNAWVFLKGLETLSVRMKAHSNHALEIARWIQSTYNLDKIFYAGLESHPDHDLAKRQQAGFGGLLSFELPGGRESAWKFINATQMVSITANLGDAKTTITHPSTTTHGRLTPEERKDAGINDNLVRIAVGLEDAGDIKLDFERGFSVLS